MERNEVFALLNGERAYQDIRWANDQAERGTHIHNPTEWLVYIQDYLQEALHIASREDDQIAHPKIMEIIRKIGGMSVAAMEQNGCEPRKYNG